MIHRSQIDNGFLFGGIKHSTGSFSYVQVKIVDQLTGRCFDVRKIDRAYGEPSLYFVSEYHPSGDIIEVLHDGTIKDIVHDLSISGLAKNPIAVMGRVKDMFGADLRKESEAGSTLYPSMISNGLSSESVLYMNTEQLTESINISIRSNIWYESSTQQPMSDVALVDLEEAQIIDAIGELKNFRDNPPGGDPDFYGVCSIVSSTGIHSESMDAIHQYIRKPWSKESHGLMWMDIRDIQIRPTMTIRDGFKCISGKDSVPSPFEVKRVLHNALSIESRLLTEKIEQLTAKINSDLGLSPGL